MPADVDEPVDCFQGMRRFLDMYESAGVEVSGDDVAILEMVEKEQALLDSDDEGESEDSDDEGESEDSDDDEE